jgi:transposase
VLLWRERFAQGGPAALTEIQEGRGRKRHIAAKKVRAIVDATLHTKPKAATHWSCRTMAAAQGVSPATVQRIWDAHGLQPHRVETFKLSRDPRFVEKLTDVVGLYLNPPDKAVVLCVDEKSQIQALDRTQPGLPLKKGRCGTMTHDYKRNGTTTLFAALNVLEGTVIGECLPRHRHQEFLKFLRRLDREFPQKLDLHLIVDNYGTHKHESVKRWLARHSRFHLHFIPTSSSWLNLVERWFREITGKRIRRGVFHSVADLIQAIDEYLETYNENPRPFAWTASVDAILRKVGRCKAVLETLH